MPFDCGVGLGWGVFEIKGGVEGDTSGAEKSSNASSLQYPFFAHVYLLRLGGIQVYKIGSVSSEHYILSCC